MLMCWIILKNTGACQRHWLNFFFWNSTPSTVSAPPKLLIDQCESIHLQDIFQLWTLSMAFIDFNPTWRHSFATDQSSHSFPSSSFFPRGSTSHHLITHVWHWRALFQLTGNNSFSGLPTDVSSHRAANERFKRKIPLRRSPLDGEKPITATCGVVAAAPGANRSIIKFTRRPPLYLRCAFTFSEFVCRLAIEGWIFKNLSLVVTSDFEATDENFQPLYCARRWIIET